MELEEMFNKKLDKLIELVEESNYSGAANLSTKLIYTSLLMENKRGVFLCEFLEKIFNEIESDVENAEESEKSKLSEELAKQLKKLREMDFLKSGSKSDLLDTLVDMRYQVTEFQLNQQLSPKRERRRFPELSGAKRTSNIMSFVMGGTPKMFHEALSPFYQIISFIFIIVGIGLFLESYILGYLSLAFPAAVSVIFGFIIYLFIRNLTISRKKWSLERERCSN